jgi:hypothetical protein
VHSRLTNFSPQSFTVLFLTFTLTVIKLRIELAGFEGKPHWLQLKALSLCLKEKVNSQHGDAQVVKNRIMLLITIKEETLKS